MAQRRRQQHQKLEQQWLQQQQHQPRLQHQRVAADVKDKKPQSKPQPPLPHFIAGLGDGDVHLRNNGLRGGSRDNGRRRQPNGDAEAGERLPNRYVRKRDALSARNEYPDMPHGDDDEGMPPFRRGELAGAGGAVPKSMVRKGPVVGGHFEDYVDALGDGGGLPRATPADPDGPWQISVLALIGIIGVLLGLFVHFVTDPGQTHYGPSYGRPRQRHQRQQSALLRTKKKKTDEWSEDEILSDQEYKADTEGGPGGGGGRRKAYRSPPPVPLSSPDPTARLYYPHIESDRYYPQQQHRQRKPSQASKAAAASSTATTPTASGTTTTAASTALHSPVRPYSAMGNNRAYQRPTAAAAAAASQSPLPSPLPSVVVADNGQATPPPVVSRQESTAAGAITTPAADALEVLRSMEPADDAAGLGMGLEGFSVRDDDGGGGKSSDVAANVGKGGIGPALDASSSHSKRQETGEGRSEEEEAAVADAPPPNFPAGSSMVVQPMGTFSPSPSFASMPSMQSVENLEGAGESSTEESSASNVSSSLSPAGKEKNSGPLHKREESLPGHQLPFPNGVTTGSVAISDSAPKVEAGGLQTTNERASLDVTSSPAFHERTNAWGSSESSFGLTPGHEEMPTPRTDHRNKDGNVGFAHRQAASDAVAESSALTRLGTSHPSQGSSSDALPAAVSSTAPSGAAAVMFDGIKLPFVPELDHEISDVKHAPRSVLMEDLHLVRMESGVEGPRWRTKSELESNSDPEIQRYVSVFPSPPQLNRESKFHNNVKPQARLEIRQPSERPEHPVYQLSETLRQRGAQGPEAGRKQSLGNREERADTRHSQNETPSGPSDDPRQNIKHKRSDLTDHSDASSSLSSPIRFSELNLIDVIGGGGFGQVWKATWRGTPVAVKVLTGSAQSENVPKAILEEFVAEINMLSGMRHPNICLYMGACLDPPNRAIVTELAAHGSLWDALRQPLSSPYAAADGKTRSAWPLTLYDSPTPREHVSSPSPPYPPSGTWPWVLVKRVAAGAARGMTYLHSGNPPVLHRDLKSANLLLDESYTTKLADFGLSRLKAHERSGMTGNCGTVQWMPPEVLANESYAEPADVYSFGIILWELLTGECPYEGMSPIQVALAVLNKNARPEIPAWCPPALTALINNCLEKDPSCRPTFPQIIAALDAMP